MKKIKLIFSILTVFVMLFSVSFAAGENFAITANYDDSSQVTVNIVANADCVIAESGTIQIDFNGEVWSFVSSSSNLNNSIFDQGSNYLVWNSPASITNVNEGDVVATFVLSLKDGAEAYGSSFTFNVDSSYITNDWTTAVPYTVSSATIARPVAANANTTVAGYTDVVNFNSSLTGVTATNPKLAFDLYENGAKHKSYTVNLGDGVSLDGGTLSFKIAVYGAPTGKTITLVNPEVK